MRKISLVLIFTMLFSIFMHKGWYKPGQAQAAVAVLTAPTNGYNAAAFPTSFAVTKPAGTNRMMVVAVTSNIGTAATQTCSVTYGTRPLTKIVTDETVSKRAHTWLFYLNEADVAAASTTALVATVTGGTTEWNRVYYAFYQNVDQSASPIRDFENYNTTAGTNAVGPFGTPLNIVAGDEGVEIVNITRVASTTARTITTWATGWTSAVGPNSSTTTNASSAYVAQNTTAGTTASQHTASGTAADQSMSAITIKQLIDLTIGNGTNPSSGNAPQGSTGNAMDAFTLGMRTGTATVNTMTLTGGAQFISSNVAAIKIYRDNGTIGALDGADVLVPINAPSWAANIATLTFTAAESVTITTVNYLVVVDVASGAAVGNALSGTITAVTGTGLGVIDYGDSSSAGLTITRSGLGVGNGLNPANASMPQASLKNAMNAFTLDMGVGSGTVNTMTLTGSAQFTTTNVAGIKVYREMGSLGVLDGTDVLVPTTYTHAGTNATITFTTPEPVSTTTVKYLVAIDAASGATVGNTLSGTITAATGTGIGVPEYTDTGSGTLTIAAGGALTIGDGTNPASNPNVPAGSYDNALDAFTTVLSAGKGQLTVLTLTGSANFTTTNIANVKIFADSAPLGTLNGSDMRLPTTYTQAGTIATITFTNPEAVSTTVRNYLVVVDVKPGATVAQAFSAYISTPATGTGYTGSPTFSDAGTTNLTIAKAAAVNSSCTGCHGYSSAAVTGVFYDGTSRNTPPGAFVGSHETHVGQYGKICSTCHVAPATETSADYKHRSGTIEMAPNINGDAGGAYGKGTSWPQTNLPSLMQACSNVYCHSQGTGATTEIGETRTMSAPLTTLNWGQTGACNSCHGFPPNYANGATTWGAAKANSHSVHTTLCQTCHNATTTTGDSITGAAQHADKTYDIAAGNGVTIGSYVYAVGGGTCTDISCHGGTATNNAAWGTSLDCTTCHNKVVNSPRAAALNAAVTTRRAVATEFNNTWSHKRSASGAVTKYDCCVCHMEGDTSTGQADLAYHGNGNIELRDPDTGSQVMQVSMSGDGGTWNQTTPHTAAGSYSSTATPLAFVRFSRDLSVRLEADANWQISTAIQINQCLKCHDANGATSAAARVPGGSAEKPFGTTIAGAAYTGTEITANGVAGGVTDINASFATANSSIHPVRGRVNNSYTQGTRMAAPWNMTKTTGNNTQYGYLISCWDCHALPTDTGTITQTVTAHGAAQTMRGNPTVPNGAAAPAAGTNEATLCKICHAGYNISGGPTHGAGSAFSSSANNGMTITMEYGCNMCHSSAYDTPAVRPVRAIDVHGVNALPTATVTLSGRWATGTDKRPYAFIRNTTYLGNHQPANIAGTAYSPGCDMAGSSGAAGQCNNQGPDVYTVGGTY